MEKNKYYDKETIKNQAYICLISGEYPFSDLTEFIERVIFEEGDFLKEEIKPIFAYLYTELQKIKLVLSAEILSAALKENAAKAKYKIFNSKIRDEKTTTLYKVMEKRNIERCMEILEDDSKEKYTEEEILRILLFAKSIIDFNITVSNYDQSKGIAINHESKKVFAHHLSLTYMQKDIKRS